MSAPPGLTVAAARASSRACSCARRGTSCACRRQRRSARDASVPRPLHGASSSTASNVPSHAAGSSRASARTTSTPSAPRRARLARSSPARASSTSTAVIAAPRAAAPPAGSSWRPARRTGPAPRAPARSRRPPRPSPAICEPRDCGVTSPSRTPLERSSGGPRRAGVRQAVDAARLESLRGQRLARGRQPAAQPVGAQAALGRGVGGLEQRRGALRRRAPRAAAYQPQRVREPAAQARAPSPSASSVELRPAVGGHAPEHGVDEPAGALALARRERDARRPPPRRRARGRGTAAGTRPGAARRARRGRRVLSGALVYAPSTASMEPRRLTVPLTSSLARPRSAVLEDDELGQRRRRLVEARAARAQAAERGERRRPRGAHRRTARAGRRRSGAVTAPADCGRRRAGTRRPSCGCGPPAAARGRPASPRRRR